MTAIGAFAQPACGARRLKRCAGDSRIDCLGLSHYVRRPSQSLRLTGFHGVDRLFVARVCNPCVGVVVQPATVLVWKSQVSSREQFMLPNGKSPGKAAWFSHTKAGSKNLSTQPPET